VILLDTHIWVWFPGRINCHGGIATFSNVALTASSA